MALAPIQELPVNKISNREAISKSPEMGANSPVAKALLAGIEAVKYLTNDQRGFLDSLSRKKELDKDKYSSFSSIIQDVELSNFCAAFPTFDTPLALHIVQEARKKVGVTA